MKISEIEFIPIRIKLSSPYRPAWYPNSIVDARSGTLVRLHTDTGIIGYGWQNSIGSEVKSVGESEFFRDLILNLDVSNIERASRILSGLNTRMYAVEMAMWDALGKSANISVHRLLGGAQERVMAYASTAEMREPKTHAAMAMNYWEMGFHAIKLRAHHERPEDDIAMVRAVREAVPEEMAIMVDANQASPTSGPIWSFERAKKMAIELEKLNVLWLEEPLHHEAHEDLARLCSEVDILIAGGEDEQGLYRFRDLLTRGCFDIVQPDVAMSGGILQLRKIAAVAESMNKIIVPHSFDSGIGLASALQVIGSVPNSPFVEYAMEPPGVDLGHDKMLKTPIEIRKDGYVNIPDRPGLGVEVDEQMIDRCRV